jgi:PAS domain S-box-containing protein
MQDFIEPGTKTNTPSFLFGGGEMGTLMRAYNWKQTSLGVPAAWPQSLCTAVGILLHSKFPMFLFWGDEAICFYNDAYRPSLGKEGEGKHPCIGKKGKEVWPEIWHIIGPQIEQVMSGGGATWYENQLIPIYRNGKIEDVYWTYSYSPVFNEEGHVAGVYVTCTETTQGVKALAGLRQSEQQLKESKERLQAALDASLTGTFRWNLQTNELQWDENLDRLFGLPPGKTVQSLQSFIDRVHPADQQEVIDRCLRCAREGADFDMEFRVIWPDGSLHWLDDKGKTFFDAEGKPLYMTGACVDITEHKAANEALLKSEQRFEAAVHAVQGVLWTNNAQGEMEGEQPGWSALTGQQYEEYQGYGWSKAVHPDDAQPTIDAWNEAVREKKTFVFEHRVKLKTGEWNLFSIRAIPLLNSDGTIREWVGVHTNISRQKEAAEKLRESEERLRLFVDHAPAAIAMFDRDIRYLAVSQRWMKDYSLTGHIAGRSHYDVFPDMPQRWKDIHQRALQGEVLTSDEDRFDREDGSIIWLKWEVRPWYNGRDEVGGIIVFSEDVTERKEVQAALQKSESRFRSTFENAAVGVAHVGMDGSWMFINQKVAEITGYTKEELTRLTFQDITHPEDLQTDLAYIQELLAGNIATYSMEKRYVRKNGSMVWVNLTVSLLREEDGKPKYFVSIVQDISERKKAEMSLIEAAEQLARERERLNMALHTGNLGAYEWKPDQNLVWWSPETYQVMSMDKHSFVPTVEAFNSLIHPDDRELVWRRTKESMQSGSEFNMEYRIVGADGKVRWILNRSRMVLDEAQQTKVVTGIVTDITERKEAEEKIRRSERYFRELTDTVPAIIWITRPDGYCTYLNKHWYDFTGQTQEEAEGFGWLNATHPDDKEEAAQKFIQATEKREPYYMLYRLRHTSGDYRWAIDSGSPKYSADGVFEGMIGTVVDVHEQRLAEDKIKESSDQLNQLSDFMPQIVWATKADGYHDFFNQRWYDFTGLSYEETKATGWSKVLHPEDYERTWQVWNNSLQTGELYEIEYRMRRRDGNYRWLLARAMPFRNAEGQIIRWFGTCTDIHEQKTGEERLEALVAERTRELQRSNEDLQQFAHVASHDLKEPVRKVITFQNLLKDELGENISEKAQSYLQKIEASSSRMYSMIDGVLAYSTLGATGLTPEPVDLNEVLKNIVTDLEVPIVQKRAIVRYGALPVVKGSPVLLYQLFYNLIANSLKFARPDVQPIIHIHTDAGAGAAERKEGQQNQHQIVVEDNGIGFHAEDAHRIFQTFTRLNAKDKYEGTGLGLSLCKKIAERHGGTIQAEGVPGVGARFILRLPV